MAKCKKTAFFLVPWAGKQVRCCEEHARHLAILSEAIGSPIQIAKVPMLEECEMEETPSEQ